MEPNLLSCPTCGHSVNSIAGACTYCGAIVEEIEPQPQAENKNIGEKAQMADLPPPLPNQQALSADEMPNEAGDSPPAAQEQSESDALIQPVDSPTTAEASEPSTETQAASPEKSTSADPGTQSEPAVDDQGEKAAPQSSLSNQNLEDNPDNDLNEFFEAESVSDAAAEPAAETAVDAKLGIEDPEDEILLTSDNVISIDQKRTESAAVTNQTPPETEPVDKPGDEAFETEASGEAQAEPVESDAALQKPPSQPTAETSPAPENPDQEAETKIMENIAPNNKAENTVEAVEASTSESDGDTIILEVENEVEPVGAVSADKTEEPARTEPLAEAKQQNMPNAGPTEAQTIKQQKAALAKAQALKKKNLALAKAAVMKRKKEMQARAQANAETLKKKGPAAATASHKLKPGPESNAGMQTLLERYKGRVIGINYDNSADIKKAQLVEANAEYFSVFVKEQNLRYSYPVKAILTLIEGKDGVNTSSSKQAEKFIAVIKVYPLVLF